MKKPSPQKVFYVEEVLEDSVLSTKQMLEIGINSKPGFLKKLRKVTSASPDTDVPLEAKLTGEMAWCLIGVPFVQRWDSCAQMSIHKI